MTNVLPFAKPAVSFDEFWAIYPRKKNKKQARKTFDKIRWTPELWEQVRAALEWQTKEWAQRPPNFTPHASTYLNNERWEDEPDRVTEPCSWSGCTNAGVGCLHEGGKAYCNPHMQALERGETPTGR